MHGDVIFGELAYICYFEIPQDMCDNIQVLLMMNDTHAFCIMCFVNWLL